MDSLGKPLFYIILTLIVYVVMMRLYSRFHFPILQPALTSTIFIVSILLIFCIPYESYLLGGGWISRLLGPAVVALAYPLYKQRYLLKQYWPAVLGGSLCGLIVGMLSGTCLAMLMDLPSEYLLSVLPKSITTPVAIQISGSLGGDTTLTSVFVMIAGFTGAVLGPLMLKMFRLDTAIGRGIGLGASAHALGTIAAWEYGEEAVSMSSVAMTVSAVIGSFLSPVVAWFLVN